MGKMRGAWLGALFVGLLVGQGCDSGSDTAIFGDGEGGQGVGEGGSESVSEAGQGADGSGGKATAGSANAGTDTGGVPEPAVGGASEGGTPSASAGQGAGGDTGMGMAGELGAAGQLVQAGAAGEGQVGQGGEGPVCDQILLSVQGRASNVVLMIDRSGSMFDLNSNPWIAVRTAALSAIDAHAGDVDIGFLAMTGEQNSCPLLDEVAIAPDNYAPIAAKYESLAKPAKGESPFSLALTHAADMLDAGTGAGEPYALLVIDGEPDYCNDGNALCPMDAVVARIQALQALGITTLVAGLPNINPSEAARHAAALQSYANAGVGLPVASIGDTVTNIYYQCQGVAPWLFEFQATGKPAMQAIGAYSNSPGAAPYTSLDPSNASAMVSAFNNLLAQTKSCVFDIDTLAVIAGEASSGTIKVDGEVIPFSNTNGWHLSGPRAIELTGSACSAWRTPGPKQISANFPCGAVTQ